MGPQRDHLPSDLLRGRFGTQYQRICDSDMIGVGLVLVELEAALHVFNRHDEPDNALLHCIEPASRHFCGGPRRLGCKPGFELLAQRIDMPAEIERLWEEGVAWYRAAGAEIVDISLPHTKYALPAYYIVAPAEASSNLARYDGVRYGLRVEGEDIVDMYERTRAEGFGREVKRRILIGTYVLSAGYYDAYYLKALKVRRRIADDFTQAFGKVDAILTPTAPSAAFALGEKSDDPVAMYLEDIYTIATNLAGLPGMSVPCGLVDNKPVGLQIIGNFFAEARMLNIAHQYQLVTDWHTKKPTGIEV